MRSFLAIIFPEIEKIHKRMRFFSFLSWLKSMLVQASPQGRWLLNEECSKSGQWKTMLFYHFYDFLNIKNKLIIKLH